VDVTTSGMMVESLWPLLVAGERVTHALPAAIMVEQLWLPGQARYVRGYCGCLSTLMRPELAG
jgi:hypothetical protein